MRVAQRFAGYSLEEADNLRKACGKKKRELIAKEREKFVAGCERTGYGAELGDEPVRHHRALRRLRLQQAATPTATASSPTRRPGSRPTTRSSTWPPCSRRSRTTRTRRPSTSPSAGPWASQVLVPDVNLSISDFTRRHGADDGAGSIPFGLSAVRNVGEGLVGLIVAERERDGPFADFYDFCDRVDPVVLNKRTRRVADQGGGLRLPRPPAPGPAGRVRADRRPHPGPAPARGRGPVDLFGDPADRDAGGRLSTSGASPSPTSSSTRPSGWPSRRRCSAST